MDFSKDLINWYANNYRDLPWRSNNLPYNIWVSEIILQQTRVSQGIHYYQRFLNAFPTVFHLANAPLEELMKIWEGLGYYSRARNMHATAKTIALEYHGKFPDNYKGLLRLKGIGPYTAAAIASICHKEVVPVVDGNVYRVLSRFYGIHTPIDSAKGKKEFLGLANQTIDKQDPHLYNQAMMELGAIACTPRNPKCAECPLKQGCFAFSTGSMGQFPVKSKKSNTRVRYFYYLVPVHENYTFISQRKNKDIWHSLYEFPLIEYPEHKEPGNLLHKPDGLLKDLLQSNPKVTISPLFTHQLTHQRLMTYFIVILLSQGASPILKGFEKVGLKDLEKYAFPRLINRFLSDYLKSM